MYLTFQTKVPILHCLGGDVCLYHYMLWSSLANVGQRTIRKGTRNPKWPPPALRYRGVGKWACSTNYREEFFSETHGLKSMLCGGYYVELSPELALPETKPARIPATVVTTVSRI